MGNIILGNSNTTFKVGSGDCTIYLGTTLLYPQVQPFTGKFKATYSNSTTYSAVCDSSTELTTATTKPSGYSSTSMTDAVVGDCITSIGSNAFLSLNSLSSLTIPDSVETIGSTSIMLGNHCQVNLSSTNSIKYVGSNGLNGVGVNERLEFPNLITAGDYFLWIGYTRTVNNLKDVVLGEYVTSIGSNFLYVDDNSSSDLKNKLETLTIYATTPPTLGNYAFRNNYTNLTIYVPAESVNAYKAASGWSTYASRIQAIPTPSPWVTYHSGDTIPSGYYDAVRISSTTTLPQNSYFSFYLDTSYSMDYIITICGGCMCTSYDCVEYDEETGECINEDCTSWTDAWAYSDYRDPDNPEYVENVLDFTDGYWTLNGYGLHLENATAAQFDIELIPHNS